VKESSTLKIYNIFIVVSTLIKHWKFDVETSTLKQRCIYLINVASDIQYTLDVETTLWGCWELYGKLTAGNLKSIIGMRASLPTASIFNKISKYKQTWAILYQCCLLQLHWDIKYWNCSFLIDKTSTIYRIVEFKAIFKWIILLGVEFVNKFSLIIEYKTC
jgi:hypothetical protein